MNLIHFLILGLIMYLLASLIRWRYLEVVAAITRIKQDGFRGKARGFFTLSYSGLLFYILFKSIPFIFELYSAT